MIKSSSLKIVLATIIITIFSVNLNAQSSYFSIYTGYGLAMNVQSLNSSARISSSATEFEYGSYSLGEGLTVGANFGHMLTNNFGAELGVSYLFGNEFSSKTVYSSATSTTINSAKMLRLNPTLVFATDFKKINLYSKVGVLFGIGSIKSSLEDIGGNEITVLKLKFDGGIATGLTAALGAVVNFSDNIDFFTELNLISMNYSPTKGKTIAAIHNGENMIDEFTTNQIELEFVDKYIQDWDVDPVTSEPSIGLKDTNPFSSIGLVIGLRLNL